MNLTVNHRKIAQIGTEFALKFVLVNHITIWNILNLLFQVFRYVRDILINQILCYFLLELFPLSEFLIDHACKPVSDCLDFLHAEVKFLNIPYVLQEKPFNRKHWDPFPRHPIDLLTLKPIVDPSLRRKVNGFSDVQPG